MIHAIIRVESDNKQKKRQTKIDTINLGNKYKKPKHTFNQEQVWKKYDNNKYNYKELTQQKT